MVKVAKSKQPATSFLQLLLGKEEPANARCGLSPPFAQALKSSFETGFEPRSTDPSFVHMGGRVVVVNDFIQGYLYKQ